MLTTMRIFGFTRYGGPDVGELMDVPAPHLSDDPAHRHVLVDMLATTVNPADIKVREGQRRGKVEVHLPMAMGREAAGRVIAASPSTGFQAGDLVVGGTASGNGSYAEQVELDAAQTALIPDGVSPEQAACVPVAAGTAWDGLHELRELGLSDGGTVIVLGAGGGVGHAVVQLARHLGHRVIGVASASKKDLVTSLGGEFVVSGEGWVDRVRDAVGADTDDDAGSVAIFDTVGPPVLDDLTAAVPVADGLVRSTAGGPSIARRRTTAVFTEILELITSGTVSSHISAVHRLEDAAAAVAAVEDGHTAGKVIIVT
jgi:NADPH:quinone reductase-like Zn-dependent oxidoreductase